MEVNLTACKYRDMKKQGFQRMILFIVELFANVNCFSFYIKHLNHHTFKYPDNGLMKNWNV